MAQTVAPTSGSLTTRDHRRAAGVKWKLHKINTQIWAYPWIQATGPEQLIFMELMRRHIYFHFQEFLSEAVPAVRNWVVLDQSPYRADFIIPDYKIVLDPWDDYHHSIPKQAQADATKLAVYQALGFTTYHVWSTQLMQNGVAWWFAQIPALSGPTKRGGYKLYHTQNDAAGIQSANRARRVFKSPVLRTRRARGRKHA